MGEIPKIHPADRAAAAVQLGSLLMVGVGGGVTTYGAAQTWGWLPGWSGAAAGALGGVGAAIAVLGGQLAARVAGQQDARRALGEHREAQARFRAAHGEQDGPTRVSATVGGRHRRIEPGRRAGGWREVGDQAAIAPAARRVLGNAAEHRFALPVGSRGTAAAAARLVGELPAGGVDVVDGAAEVAEVDQGGAAAG